MECEQKRVYRRRPVAPWYVFAAHRQCNARLGLLCERGLDGVGESETVYGFIFAHDSV